MKGAWALVGCGQRGFGARLNNGNSGEGASTVISGFRPLGSGRGAVQGPVWLRTCWSRVYLLRAVLGLRCCVQAFSSCCEWGLLFIAVREHLVGASLIAE